MVGRLIHFGLMLALALAGACGSREAEVDALLRRARDLRAANDLDAAQRAYYEVLGRQPDLAEAHLELGQLFDQAIGDDIRAVYHYQRFLEIDRKSERAALVKDLIRTARISFAKSVPEATAELNQRILALQREIQLLRLRNAELAPEAPMIPAPATGVVAVVQAPVPVAPSTPPPAPVSAPAPPESLMYTVKRGDTLRRIAAEQLGDREKWKLILSANADRIGSQNLLKVGQQIAIPKR